MRTYAPGTYYEPTNYWNGYDGYQGCDYPDDFQIGLDSGNE